MTFTKDSPLAVRVVPAPDNWSRGGASVKGIVIHMAEGGGTVSWLTRNDGNSSHYVVEYGGDIVQMVDEDRAAGSINPSAIRQTNDQAYSYLGSTCQYGRTAAVAVMGAGANNPNRFCIAIEVEGFAAVGPNSKQRLALHALVEDIRRRRGRQGTLGHRDFQSYKACPGHHIPWIDYGGHAVIQGAGVVPVPKPPVTGGTSVAIQGSTVPEVPTRLFLRDDPAKAGRSRWLYVWSDHRADPGNKQLEPQRPLLLTRFIDADTYAVAYESTTPDANTTSLEMFVHSADVLRTEAVPSSTDCSAAVKAATDPLKQQLAIAAIELSTAETDKAALALRLNGVKVKANAFNRDIQDD